MREYLRYIFLCLVAVTTGISGAYAGDQVERKPRLELSHDQFYFGYLPAGAIVQHSYWIRNKGNDTLQIISVKPGCGCTTAPLSKDHIAPDDSALLRVTFDSKNMVGSTVKMVDIFSNDPAKPSTSVRFVAVVNRSYPAVKELPDMIRFTRFGSKGGKLIKTLELQNTSNEALEYRLVDLPREYVTIDKTEGKLPVGGKAVFELEQIKTVRNESDIMTSVTFEFTGKESERITIPIVAYFQK